MFTQTIFQAGNSNVIAIPKQLLNELGFKLGQKVIIDKMDENTIVVKKLTATKTKQSASEKEFKKWLDVFTKENSEILDELAKH